MKSKPWTPDPDRQPSPWFIDRLREYDALDVPSFCDNVILEEAWKDDQGTPPGESSRPFTSLLIQIQTAARLGWITSEEAGQHTGRLFERMAGMIPFELDAPEWRSRITDGYRSRVCNVESDRQGRKITDAEADRQKVILLDEALTELVTTEERERIIKSERRKRRHAEARGAFTDGIPHENAPESFDPTRLKCPLLHDDALAEFTETDTPFHYWHGESGTGKSWTAVMTGIQEFGNGLACDVRFIPASRLKDRLAGLKDADDKAAFIDDVAGCDLLILDDLFHSVSGPFLESLRRILSERGDAPTIITSNFSLDAVRRLGAGKEYEETIKAVVRRIEDRAAVLEFSLENEAALKASIESNGGAS